MKLYLIAKGTPLMEKGYNGVFESLPKEKKSDLIGRKSDFAKIASLMIDEMKEPLAEKNIILNYDQKALEAVAEKSFGKVYGARDIRRVVRKEIEDKIADVIIEHSGDVSGIGVTAENGEIKIEYM